MAQQIKVKLSKFNNQSGQYVHYLTMDVDARRYKRWAESPNRISVPGHYMYEGEVAGKIYLIYSVSPALFDHPEKQPI